jgi:hypothetical protein
MEPDPYRFLCREVAKQLKQKCESKGIHYSAWSIERLVADQIWDRVGKMMTTWLENNQDEKISDSDDHDEQISGSDYNDEILRKYACNEVSCDLYKNHLYALVDEIFNKIVRDEQMRMKAGKRKEAIVKKSLSDVYEKYYAEGRVLIGATIPRKYKSIVGRLLQCGGMMKLVPKFDFEMFYTGLLNEGVPPEDAQTITKSMSLIEDEAYFVPQKLDS